MFGFIKLFKSIIKIIHPKRNRKIFFLCNRYDYLRIGKRILDDWNNDTCVGKYLKTIYEQRINKNRKVISTKSDLNILKNMVVNFTLILLVY